mmetsp:Transcript_12239/g.38782  ORF Transcript_12239/g.38782 Transcript_12239/m.38782 type:complete len:181 (+) Transcript_12239:537-1079(+)
MAGSEMMLGGKRCGLTEKGTVRCTKCNNHGAYAWIKPTVSPSFPMSCFTYAMRKARTGSVACDAVCVRGCEANHPVSITPRLLTRPSELVVVSVNSPSVRFIPPLSPYTFLIDDIRYQVHAALVQERRFVVTESALLVFSDDGYSGYAHTHDKSYWTNDLPLWMHKRACVIVFAICKRVG